MLILLLVLSASAETTTRTYDIDVPGSDPIRIVEGENPWQSNKPVGIKQRFEHRSFDTKPEHNNDELQQFLNDYASKLNNNKPSSDESSDASGKSWDLLQFQKHNHPYEDKKGWVSMEPVPWSVSKISKWHSKHQQQQQHHQQQKPWVDDEDYDDQPLPSYRPKPSTYQPQYKPIDSRPSYSSRPSAVYAQKVHVTGHNPYHHDENCNHHDAASSEIITDGLPPNFPQAYGSANRRRGTDINPDINHPFSEEGDWVLLSTTKGYKFPQQRQRSMKIEPDAMGVHRTVRLTVLPPLKNSKINMTTSHGGLLQVESTFQTVEEAQRQYAKKQHQQKRRPQKQQPQNKPNHRQPQKKKATANNNHNQQRQPQVQMLRPTMVTTAKMSPQRDSSAVLAAVGAGMIPATMAMLVPMAMGGRKRRKRDIFQMIHRPYVL